MSTAVALSSSPLPAPVSAGQTSHSSDSDFTFDDLISIVNPLQHLPVASTIYRSLTGDTIKPFERILGDTLYGGMWGFASAVANVVYQDVTGKDFGQTVLDTAMELVNGGDDDATTASGAQNGTSSAATAASINPDVGTATAQPASLPGMTPDASVANGPPRALQSPTLPTSTTDSATLALMHALSDKGVDPTLSQRAVSAYKKSLQAQPAKQAPPTTPVPTS